MRCVSIGGKQLGDNLTSPQGGGGDNVTNSWIETSVPKSFNIPTEELKHDEKNKNWRKDQYE